MTAERNEDYGPISRFGFEEFVADNVIILRNALDSEKRRRTVEVLKLRGGSHLRGRASVHAHAGPGPGRRARRRPSTSATGPRPSV